MSFDPRMSIFEVSNTLDEKSSDTKGLFAVPGYANLQTTLDQQATSIANNYGSIAAITSINLNNLTTANVSSTADKNYVTDAQLELIGEIKQLLQDGLLVNT